ncbi:MAG: hypothetical protein ABIK61_06195 [candidate division WOR-3 bacterium]
MKALVINCSTDYNLGVEKIANWLKHTGHQVVKSKPKYRDFDNYDIVYLSALYTWDLPILVSQAKQAVKKTKVEIGGPAVSVMSSYIINETGIEPKIGLDRRFDLEPGKYLSTYTSRGCIRNCEFCSVPIVEGSLRELSDFNPAPIVLDPNFLACSKKHIENACEKLSHLRYIDFLHGLDARLLESWHIELFLKRLNVLCWRFTFDSLRNEMALKNALKLLKNFGIKSEEKVIIYCIYGFNEKPKDAYERVKIIKELNAHPYAMRYQPLNALYKNNYFPKDWQKEELIEFEQFCNIPTLRWLNNLLRTGVKNSYRAMITF